MGATADDKRNWLRTALGVDLQVGLASDQKLRRAPAPDAETSAAPSSGAKTPKTPTKNPASSDPEIEAALKALKEEGDALKKLGIDNARIEADRAALFKAETAAFKQADATEREKALGQVKKRANDALDRAKALSKSVKDIMGAAKGKPTGTQKTAIFKKALQDLYGLQITIPEGMKNTHLDKVFDMFAAVPMDHVKHDKLTKLTYSKAEKDKGSGAYGSAEIDMGDFGKAKGKETYVLDGKAIPANSFNVTTLHEIGHAVDEKNGIMRAHQGKDGCGGWVQVDLAVVAAAFLGELKKTAKLKHPVAEDLLLAAVKEALQEGTTTQPDSVGDREWKVINTFLIDKCLAVREDAAPWFADRQVVVDNMVYQQSYAPHDWWSYKFAARAATKVNAYQWRSPYEWFAEVYAISWLAKKPPPKAVDAAVLPFMWKP